MTKVFIGGSRRITRLDTDVKLRIDRIIEKRFPIIVGDAGGVDKAVQKYLLSRNYDLVEVFCSGDSSRNNIGGWPVRYIPVERKKRDFSFYAAKDRAMAEEASFGLMLWDKKSTGTLMNVLRLVRLGKKVIIYSSPDREFIDVTSESEWNSLFSKCPLILRNKIERTLSAEELHRNPADQGNLFEFPI